ncbi:CHASE domain-containing protein [Sulfitobacter sp. TSTF-M16]|uniref:histidine kinase n=2 Tax=Sulfitobacter aestuariivivens TaxID=2766981 RepID=A0A927HEN9_9RHOB|nr:CHASE domain-containing protein [Sulfitobacter aestuariivivens]
MRARATPPAPFQSLGSRVSILHVVIVGLSMVMTIGAWSFSKKQIETRNLMRFETARNSVVELIHDGMRRYEDALWAGVSAMESHGGDMTLAQWRSFAQALRVDEKYPGINGIGVIHFVGQEALAGYLAQRRAERPEFVSFPDHDGPIRMPISFVEPESANAAAIGLDVAHEANRRTAALLSRETGRAQISGPITLVQDAASTPGFLFFAPYYAGPAPGTVRERREQIIGSVYAPFVVHKLMAGLLAKDRRDIHFSITDAGQMIYSELGTDEHRNDPEPMFAETVSMQLYGREWVVDIRTNLAFRTKNTYAQPWVILAGGLIIEVLIISMLLLMSRGNARAIAYAEKATLALREKTRKLNATNNELEQFAYAASHDLKTPIRGIGGLAEMLREDLADYLASPEANPEIAENLDHIDERVARMTDLTNSIMAFARVGTVIEAQKSLNLAEVISTLALDFGLQDDQLEFEGEIPLIEADPVGLRRILENLVGNAIKYHDGVKPLAVKVRARAKQDRLYFEVIDNGPGIEPRFHQRIFDVFQTLRRPNGPESTGIGLAIVKKLVEMHGGTITLKSNLGHGAAFYFDWPAKQDAVDISAALPEAA